MGERLLRGRKCSIPEGVGRNRFRAKQKSFFGKALEG